MPRVKKKEPLEIPYNPIDTLPEPPDPYSHLNALQRKIVKGIHAYMSPVRLALLLGMSELDLKSLIVDDTEFLTTIRELLFNMQADLATEALSMIDKKAPTDFFSMQANDFFDLWARFVATDMSMASDFLLLSSAIAGGIGKNTNFWKNAPTEIKNSFKTALRTNENFTRMFFDAIEGAHFELGIHHKAMFEELDLISKGLTDILIINIAPRVGKSTTLYSWATKTLMQKPNSSIIYGSYGEVVLTLIRKRIDLAFEASKQDDNKINPFYEIYRNTKAKGFAKESDFMTEINSMFFSATILGGITGRGYSVYETKANGAMIIDDPNNPNDVGTARMETVAEKFFTTWYPSRAGLNPLILIMQRLADNDLTACILDRYKESELNIRVLTLPMEMTEEVDSYIAKQQAKYPAIHFINPLKYMEMGDTLLPAKSVEKIKQSAHPAVYKTQYLQIPTNFEGSIFKSRMFYNKVNFISPVTSSIGQPIGFVKVNGIKRILLDDVWHESNVDFDGVFILHIDTTSGNTDTSTKDVDDCVWTLMVGGLKDRKAEDNWYGAILHQHALNSKLASDVVMQDTTLEILQKLKEMYNKDNKKEHIPPFVAIAIETHSQGGGLASFLRGKKLQNVAVISYSRQNFGNKQQRFIQGSGFYEDRLFWWQGDECMLAINDIRTKSEIKINDWYYAGRMQHLSFNGENTRLHDDYIEAPVDLANLWIANDGKDKIYQEYIKMRGLK